MFTAKYFNPRYWAGRYWPKLGGEVIKPSGYLVASTSVYPALTAKTSVKSALEAQTNVIN